MATEKSKERTIDFGFRPASGAAYHFVVRIPRDEDGMVIASEHFVYKVDVEELAQRVRMGEVEPLPFPIRPPLTKVEVPFHKWRKVAERAKIEFNKRLLRSEMRASSWKTGENRVASQLGKELVLLLWAIEDIEPSQIDTVVANWEGLAPEERWWLYTTINASAGHASWGRGRGWRKAIGIALSETTPREGQTYFSQSAPEQASVSDAPTDSKRRRGKRTANDDTTPSLAFDDLDTQEK